MNSSRLKYEGLLYWFAFLLALGFRFIQLGASSLTDSEANLALQALHVAQGKSPLLDPQPAYILFTSILFAVIESTNFMARFGPALVGSALIFVPYFFREKINARPALILAFLFAFSPGLVALSRQASGTILAVSFLLFAWGMWINRRAIAWGIFLGLALLSGPSLWAGLLPLGLVWLFYRT
jgi:predicted membrane-bound mannosyltransferase